MGLKKQRKMAIVDRELFPSAQPRTTPPHPPSSGFPQVRNSTHCNGQNLIEGSLACWPLKTSLGFCLLPDLTPHLSMHYKMSS